ncbi:Atrophin-1 superfamily incomplete domain containing protein [Pandoravirus celtis]|uniref:Atrophin-1 superfamily incomplete domain containing protein n=1 Tax=Pandoravirus celtis TaxID=2568002 RepID=A0A4D6EGY8_9VIRU|nr:Atrophin-1 superfamily incomplete domain containing protein [Pandoravirus celtis]
MEAPTSATAATTLYDRNNPALGAAVGYLGSARPGGLYRIALAPDPETPPGAIVEFPYRLATVIGGQYYFVLDPAAARDPEQAAFMRAYMNEPGVTLALGQDAYTLPVRAVAAPGGGGVRLVARTRPAGVSPDNRYYIGRSTEIDTVRRIDGAAAAAPAAEPIQGQPLTAVDRADLIALNPFPAPSEREQREQQRRRIAAAGPRTLGQLVAASQQTKAAKRQAWADRFTRPRRGRGRKVGGTRSDVGGIGGVRLGREESSAEPIEDAEALATYKRDRAAQLERSVEWVQSRQQRQAQIAAGLLEEAQTRASEEARVRAQAEVEAMGGAIPATRLAAEIRHRRAEIARALVDQAAVDAIQRQAAVQAQADTDAAIREQVEREVGAGLFHTVPRVRGRRPATAAAAPVNVPAMVPTAAASTSLATAVPPEINVQPQPAMASSVQPTAEATARSRRNSDAAVRAAAMSVFQDTVAQRLAHLPDDSPAIRDIIAEWSAATRSNPAGLTPAMLRERAVQWWASQRWADVPPAERARYAEGAKARADSDAIVAAEAAVRHRIEESAAAAGMPGPLASGTVTPAAAQRRRRRQEAEGEEVQGEVTLSERRLPEPEQAKREAQRAAAAAPPTKRLRRGPMLAPGPPPVAVRTAAGDLVEVPRPALAPVPQPVAAGLLPAPMGIPSQTTTSRQPARGFGAAPARVPLPLGVSRLSVPGGGLLGRVASAPSPLSTTLIARQTAGTVSQRAAPTPAEDVALRLRQLAETQAERGAALQRQTALQWARGM